MDEQEKIAQVVALQQFRLPATCGPEGLYGCDGCGCSEVSQIIKGDSMELKPFYKIGENTFCEDCALEPDE